MNSVPRPVETKATTGAPAGAADGADSGPGSASAPKCRYRSVLARPNPLDRFTLLLAYNGHDNEPGASEELTSTENKVAFARQAYNDSVMVYNTSRETFPTQGARQRSMW